MHSAREIESGPSKRMPDPPYSGATLVSHLVMQLKDLISEQSLSPGDKIPSESAICAHFGISRSTAREALKVLEQEGLVKAIRGHGRFLTTRSAVTVKSPVTEYQSITEMLQSRGFEMTDVVLKAEESTATSEEAQALGISVGDPTIHLVRLRLANGEPAVLCVGTVIREAFPGPLQFRDWRGSVVTMLDMNGYSIRSAAATIKAIELPEDYAHSFSLDGFGPWLLTEEICFTDNMTRVMLALDYHRGDLFSLEVVRNR